MITVTEEAIAQIGVLRNEIIELHKDLLNGAKNLLLTYEQNRNGLGYHNQSIENLLNELINDSSNDADVKKLTRRLKLSAQIRQKHIENNLYAGGSKRR